MTPSPTHTECVGDVMSHCHEVSMGRPQEGNAAWKAAAVMHACKPGLTNRTLCKHCKRIAVRGTSVCYFHGGARIIAKRKLKRRHVRHGSWTNKKIRQSAERVSIADEFSFTTGRGV